MRKENEITPETFFEENGRLRRRQPERAVALWSWLVPVMSFAFVAICLSGFVWGFLQLVRFN